jgi:Transcriptional regulator PadR-like family
MNDDRDLYSGMIRLHVLHHAEKGTIFGAGMGEELAQHGYKISPGTMYPILHGLENVATCNPVKSGPGKAYAASIGSQLLGAAPSTEPNCACGNSSES